MAALLLLIASGGSVKPGIPFIGEDSAVEVPLCGDVADLNEGTLPISPVTLGASASASFASLLRIVFPAEIVAGALGDFLAGRLAGS